MESEGEENLLMRIAFLFRFARTAAFFAAATIFTAGIVSAQQVPEQFFSEMKWRMIGPFRAGKVNAVAGVPGNPAVYYFGADGDGVYKSVDGGDSWQHIGLEETRHIGRILVDPHNPGIVLVAAMGHSSGS